MIKTQIQLLGEGTKGKGVSPMFAARQVIEKSGFAGFYTGLSAGLLRQATYTTARLGIYNVMTQKAKESYQGPLPLSVKLLMASSAGGLAAVFGTPADVALIRMQNDIQLPPAERRNYTGVVNALSRMLREEGLTGLFAGNTPVVIRAAALNAGMLAFNDQVQELLQGYTTNALIVSGGAKFSAGFAASFFSLPFDFLKTRLQNRRKVQTASCRTRASLIAPPKSSETRVSVPFTVVSPRTLCALLLTR